ncbi:MAG: hypothetical protein OXP69_24905 [Spirochaetaceae bacterium]|nr:hypothetical protein [Spirochaetaceae bacterium]
MPALNTELVSKADRYIDEHHMTFVALGKRVFDEFGSDRGRTQVHNLQQIACSATRFADVEDFVKNQIGKGNRMWKNVGPAVLDQLSELRTWSDRLAGDPANRMALRLRLARSWTRAVVSEYLYLVAMTEMSP